MNTVLLVSSAVAEMPSLKLNWNLFSYLVNKFSLGKTNAEAILMLVGVVVCIIIPYLLGSINPAIIISNRIYNDDIRSHGSGNAGATNTLRTYGKKMALLIFACDMLKAAVAVIFGYLLLPSTIGASIAGLFVILGHMFPIYYKFKGGKGVSCACMVVLLISPISFVILISLFILIVLMTKYVSLGSIIAIMFFPILNRAFYPQNGDVTLSGFLIMCLVVFMHRENIKKLINGKESKISFNKSGKTDKKEEKSEADNSQKEYSDDDFVKCECGRLIPISRKSCAYCGTKNKFYTPKNRD